MNLKPIKNKIIVRPDPTPTQIGMIHVPDNIAHGENGNPNYFPESSTVIAVGPGVLEHIPVGHKVKHNRYAGVQIRDHELTNGEIWLVMSEDDIEVVLPPETPTVLPPYQEAQVDDVKSYDRDPFAEPR